MSIVKLNDRAVSNATTFGSISSLGEMKFISKATASSSASIEFSLGDYKEYQFYFVNCHPSSADTHFEVNFSSDSGSNYNVTKTTTHFYAYHGEIDDATALNYDSAKDLAQSTAFQYLNVPTGNQDSDKSLSGYFHLFNPSSTTYVKHFISSTNNIDMSNYCVSSNVAGYCNTTSAITNIKFQYSSGNIDAGEILLFGIN